MILAPASMVWVSDTLGVAIIPGDKQLYEPCSRCGGCGLVDDINGPRDCPTCKGNCYQQMQDERGRFTRSFVAPQEWTQYDKPCETCGDAPVCRHCGRKCITVGAFGNEMTAWGHFLGRCKAEKGCPDCRDGRQVWEVRWPCSTCGGRGYWSDDVKDGKRWVTTERTCLNCISECSCETDVHWPDNPDCAVNRGYNGFLSARATLQVVPVVASATWRDYHDRLALVVLDSGRCGLMDLDAEGAQWLPKPIGGPMVLDPLPRPGRDFAVIIRRVPS